MGEKNGCECLAWEHSYYGYSEYGVYEVIAFKCMTLNDFSDGCVV